jgi:hypothetical protein
MVPGLASSRGVRDVSAADFVTSAAANRGRRPGEIARKSCEFASAPGDISRKSGEIASAPGEITKKSGEITSAPGEITKKSGEIASPPGEIARFAKGLYEGIGN